MIVIEESGSSEEDSPPEDIQINTKKDYWGSDFDSSSSCSLELAKSEEMPVRNRVSYADHKVPLADSISKIIVAEDQLANICVLKNQICHFDNLLKKTSFCVNGVEAVQAVMQTVTTAIESKTDQKLLKPINLMILDY